MAVNVITIPRRLLEEVLSHCRESYPYEACGFLAGRDGTVEKVYRVKNIKKSSVSYEMDPKEQLRCEREIRDEGLDIVGIYHSHPSASAYPSQVDIARACWPGDPDTPLYPEACYMIVGPLDGETEVRVFRIDPSQQVAEIRLETT